jgi:hypothetical protein
MPRNKAERPRKNNQQEIRQTQQYDNKSRNKVGRPRKEPGTGNTPVDVAKRRIERPRKLTAQVNYYTH